MQMSKQHQRNKRKNNKAPPANGKNRVGRPSAIEGERKKPNGISEKTWSILKELLGIEEKQYVSEIIRKVLGIYLDPRIQDEADRQNVAPSELLERAVNWYMNMMDEERRKRFQEENHSKV